MDQVKEDNEPRSSTSSLARWVKQYCSNDSDSGCCESRNQILFSVVGGKTEEFMNLIVSSFEEEHDLVTKRNICRLVYDVVSRTEELFKAELVVPFLKRCLPVTICTHFAIVGLRALLQRHVKLEGLTEQVLLVIKQMYDEMLNLAITSMAQQPRIDFLWISHFMVDAFRRVGVAPPENLVSRFCSCVAGEKDPRNLLLLFDLITKLCGVELSDDEVKVLATLYTTYYPIQFSPPKNDKIGIKPAELKERLLETFKANRKFGSYSLEVMIDCLYSGYGTDEEHTEVLADTLRFFKECAPIYGKECHSANLQAFIDVIVSEYFITYNPDETKEHENFPDKFMSLEIGTNADELPYEEYSTEEANKLGALYYEGWQSVPRNLRLFGDIMQVFMSGIDVADNIQLVVSFIKMLKQQFILDSSKVDTANGHAGFFLDVLCGIESFHDILLKQFIVPLCMEITCKYTEVKRGQREESSLCDELNLMLPVLTNTLFAKLVSVRREVVPTKYANHIIVAALCCVQLKNQKMFTRGLKLLALGIASSRSSMLHQALNHCLKDSRLLCRDKGNCNDKAVYLYADTILAMLKCHFVHCKPLTDLLRSMAEAIIEAENVEACLGIYTQCGIDVSREIAEMVATTLEKTTDHELVETICKMCTKCVIYACEHPGSSILPTTYLFSFAVVVHRAKLGSIVKGQISLEEALQHYKLFWRARKSTTLPYATRKLVTHTLPSYMSMSLDKGSITIAKQFCSEGFAFLLPIVIQDVSEPVVKELITYSKTTEDIIDLEAIAWLVQRWVLQQLEKDNQVSTPGDKGTSDHHAVNIFELLRGLLDDSKSGEHCLDLLSSYGIPAVVFSHVIQLMSYEDLVRFDLSRYIGAVNFTVLTMLVYNMFPFHPGKLSRSLNHMGFDIKDIAGSRKGYSDIFMLDGTLIEKLDPISRDQYQFLVMHSKRDPCQDVKVARNLIELLSAMEENMTTLVVLQALVLSLDDSEIVRSFAHVVKRLFQQFFTRYSNMESVKQDVPETASRARGAIHCALSPACSEWLEQEFLFQSLVLIIRMLSFTYRTKAPANGRKHAFDYRHQVTDQKAAEPEESPLFTLEEGEWSKLTEAAISTALQSSLPVCRILSIIITHHVIKGVPNTVTKEYSKEVVKRMYSCLGDADQRVRAVALACRHMWILR